MSNEVDIEPYVHVKNEEVQNIDKSEEELEKESRYDRYRPLLRFLDFHQNLANEKRR